VGVFIKVGIELWNSGLRILSLMNDFVRVSISLMESGINRLKIDKGGFDFSRSIGKNWSLLKLFVSGREGGLTILSLIVGCERIKADIFGL